MVFVALASFLLATAIKYHVAYGEAHANARLSTSPSAISPQDHMDKALWASAGVVAIAVTALIVAVKTRRIEWIACFLVAAIIAAIAVVRTGIRY